MDDGITLYIWQRSLLSTSFPVCYWLIILSFKAKYKQLYVPLNKLQTETYQNDKIMVSVRIPGLPSPDEASLHVPLCSVLVFRDQCSLQLNILSTSEVFSTFASRT